MRAHCIRSINGHTGILYSLIPDEIHTGGGNGECLLSSRGVDGRLWKFPDVDVVVNGGGDNEFVVWRPGQVSDIYSTQKGRKNDLPDSCFLNLNMGINLITSSLRNSLSSS